EQSGRTPEDVAISFIPRDSNTVNDVWTCFAPYRRDLAEQALIRLEEVWQRVRDYDVGALEQSQDCFNCRRRWWKESNECRSSCRPVSVCRCSRRAASPSS